ncbi:MAG: AmmeMemoRadiSam system radical SAM enzyme, partial [Thermoproteota archaeon]
YGDISSISANPIEKKPFFNLHPVTIALNVVTCICKLKCPCCQNFEISKVQPDPRKTKYISP